LMLVMLQNVTMPMKAIGFFCGKPISSRERIFLNPFLVSIGANSLVSR